MARNHLMCDYPTLDIYTTEDDVNLKGRCSHYNYGQLRNENLNTPLKSKKRPYRFTTCDKDEKDSDVVNCHGEIIIQDFIPRNYGFSFGCRCDEPVRMPPLKGLFHNIGIYDQSNKTICVPTNILAEQEIIRYCESLYPFMSLPNLIGDLTLEDVIKWMNGYYLFEGLSVGVFAKDLKRCYKYFNELMCYVVVPKCDQDTQQIIHPCKEMVYELKEACMDDFISFLGCIYSLEDELLVDWNYLPEQWSTKLLDSDYLPSKDGPIPCLYKQVTCQSPPNVSNANVIMKNSRFTAKSEGEYMCQSGAFQMEGNSTSTCLCSGQWSEPPKCNARKTSNVHLLIIVIPWFIISFVTVMATITISCCKRREVQNLTRQREFENL